jgi:hypothetical protein
MPEWLSSEDLIQTVEIWGAIISTVIAFATVVQVLVTWMISRSIRKASTVNETLDQSRQIYGQWQEFNKLVITDENFRATLRKMEKLTEEDSRTQLRYLLFYILNVMNSAWLAESAKKDGFKQAGAVLRDHLSVVYAQRDLVLEIVEGGRGYSEDFVAQIKKAFVELDNEKPENEDV